MKIRKLTYLILEFNAALDRGDSDEISLDDVNEHIRARDVLPWLARAAEINLSEVDEKDADEYHERLEMLRGAHQGRELRKWGVENRGLCLLLAWTNEIVDQHVGDRFTDRLPT